MIVWITHAKVGHRQTPLPGPRAVQHGGFVFYGRAGYRVQELYWLKVT